MVGIHANSLLGQNLFNLATNYRFLLSVTGLPYHVEIYEGKTDESDDLLGTCVVMNALKVCQQPNTHYEKGPHHEMPSDRHERHEKKERGSYDFRSLGEIEIVRWSDNAVVTVGSSAYGVEPLGNAKRWMKGKG